MQIQNFLKQNPDFQLLTEKTIFPFEENRDGFYFAKLEKML